MSKISDLVNDIIALGTDHSNNPPAPQNEREAVQRLEDLMAESYKRGYITGSIDVYNKLDEAGEIDMNKLNSIFSKYNK